MVFRILYGYYKYFNPNIFLPFQNLNSSMLDQEAISVVLRSLEGLHLMHPSILATPPIFPSRTIIHLAAQLDFPSVINQAIILKYGQVLKDFYWDMVVYSL